ncbi:MAG: SurA N-terminal domain-containing protein [Nitrospira sp.]|nr:SurA N-terminal domain-containing protein [Nitrospira sp.]
MQNVIILPVYKEKCILVRVHRKFYSYCTLFFIIIISISACSSNNGKEKGEVVATVNSSPILFKEFQKELAMYSRRDPSSKINPRTVEEQLEVMIDNKLMIQEATKMGLAGNERFMETIKSFWEQTLIRDLIDAKTKEWNERLFVTEEEIQNQYKRLQYRLTLRLVNRVEKKDIEDVKKRIEKGDTLKDEEIIGPLSYEAATIELEEEILNTVFDMETGNVRAFNNKGGGMTLIQVIKKETVSVPPLKDIHDRVKTLILGQKRQEAVEEWLKDIRKTASININDPLLKRTIHE